ncbi:MAG: TetR/AcrR family transcriptional regulator [Phycisphaerales bacterium]|nr:TetR/AcrR family transcriptional regulator [Phycisphaerales bacterium]
MPTQTRQQLVYAARQRFYRDGFRNVGIDAILDDVGISKTAFYKHFACKDDLMVAVLDDVDQFLKTSFRQMIKDRGGRTADGQIRAMLDVVQQVIAQDGFHGCIFVNAAMEFPLAHDPAHQAAARHKRAIEELVFELAERAGVADPDSMAQELCLILEGAYVTCSVTGDPMSFAIARRLADQLIARHLPQPSGQKNGQKNRSR